MEQNYHNTAVITRGYKAGLGYSNNGGHGSGNKGGGGSGATGGNAAWRWIWWRGWKWIYRWKYCRHYNCRIGWKY
jgi:hypothetical protein